MWDWLNKVTDMNAITVAIPQEYKKQASLVMTKGDGSVSEKWTLFNCWPKELDWKDLDYTNSEIATVAVSMRYDRAKREAGGG
jgi:phage tail-like protein